MEYGILNIIWFLLVAVLLSVYAILDGFDFGVGILHLFTKGENEKRRLMNSIGPVWDGNEVWLLAGGGSIFAAFPLVYATVFSGFYLAVYLLLLAFFLRAVAFEFRGRIDSNGWRKLWDWAFGLGSLLPALLLGVAFGNILRGIPINDKKEFTGSFFELLNPYAILIGLLAVIMFVMQGAIWLANKMEEEEKEKYEKIGVKMWVLFITLYVIATVLSVFVSPFLFDGIFKNVIWYVLLALNLVSLANIPLSLKGKSYRRAFLFSSLTVASSFLLAAVGLFPRMVPSITDLKNSLTIGNASSTPGTLQAMLIIALIGMPFVAFYTIWIYRVFKGKTELNEESY